MNSASANSVILPNSQKNPFPMTFRPFLLLSVFSVFILTACEGEAQDDMTGHNMAGHEMAADDSAHPHHPMRANDEVRASPNAGVMQTIGTTSIHIMYGRPSVKGREIFGALVPYNEVWRTGANEATTITFSKDVTIEGQPLAAGSYGLFTIPTAGSWTFIFNRTAEQWGAFNYDSAEDALRVEVAAAESFPVEQMAFWFDEVTDTSAKAVLGWAGVAVGFEIGVAE